MSIFTPCSSDLFFKSKNQNDPRLGELASSSRSAEVEGLIFSLAGYPDDEGIGVNGGRQGASHAPDVIRKYFYKMTPSAFNPVNLQLEDEGNLQIRGTLAERHDSLKEHIARKLKDPRHVWLSLGGGHDYGFPDGAGFLAACSESKYKPLIINFDAHLDVRPMDKGISSGTPFFRLLEDRSLPSFDFVEIGLQAQCNSAAHLKWLHERGGIILGFDELSATGSFVENVLGRLAPLLLQPRPTFLSVDIDAFSSAYAPGCSQSWATGLEPNTFIPLLKILKKRLNVRALGIYEVAPPLDTDDRTSKLAAQILHSFIF